MTDTPPFFSPDRQWSQCGGISHVANPIPDDQTPIKLTQTILSALSKNDFQPNGWFTPNFGIRVLFHWLAPSYRQVFGYQGSFDAYRDVLPSLFEYHIFQGYLASLMSPDWKILSESSSNCQTVVTLTSGNKTCRLFWDLLYQPYSFGNAWKITQISFA